MGLGMGRGEIVAGNKGVRIIVHDGRDGGCGDLTTYRVGWWTLVGKKGVVTAVASSESAFHSPSHLFAVAAGDGSVDRSTKQKTKK